MKLNVKVQRNTENLNRRQRIKLKHKNILKLNSIKKMLYQTLILVLAYDIPVLQWYMVGPTIENFEVPKKQ